MVTQTNNLAKIAISKNLIKEYYTLDAGRTVYMKDSTEFQIYIKNPYQDTIGANIRLNDKYIGETLILRPGESVWLERFFTNDRKFLFSTYSVDDTAENRNAISKNGKVVIDFFHERTPINYRSDWNWNNGRTFCSSSIDNLSLNSNANFASKGMDNISLSTCLYEYDNTIRECSGSIETGRVEEGSRSDQKFSTCSVDLETWSFLTETIQILPYSRKKMTTQDTVRRYCSQCGKKVSPKDKFCSSCGAKLK